MLALLVPVKHNDSISVLFLSLNLLHPMVTWEENMIFYSLSSFNTSIIRRFNEFQLLEEIPIIRTSSNNEQELHGRGYRTCIGKIIYNLGQGHCVI